MTTTPGTASYRAYAGEDVITGEGVAVELPVASVPHRMASGAIDLLVIIGILLLAAVTFGLLTSGASQAVAATFGVVAVVVATVVVPTVVAAWAGSSWACASSATTAARSEPGTP